MNKIDKDFDVIVGEDKGYFDKPEDHIVIADDADDYGDSDDDIDNIMENASSAKAINSLVSKNIEDIDDNDEEYREQLIKEIEDELKVKKKQAEKRKMDTDTQRDKILQKRDKELESILKSLNKDEEEVLEEDNEKKEEVKEFREERIRDKKKEDIFKTDIKKKKSNYNKFLTPPFLVAYASVLVIFTIVSTILVMNNLTTSNGATISSDDKLIVRNPVNNYVLETGDVATMVNVPTSSNSNGYEHFTKIRITIKNKKSSDANISGTNNFAINSFNNEKIADCYTANDLSGYSISDALPSAIPAKSTISGYIYCKSEINYLPILSVTASKEIDQGAALRGEVVTKAAYIYYINLNK